MAAAHQRPRRARGSIERLSSGALRVSVYAGYDAVTGRDTRLHKTRRRYSGGVWDVFVEPPDVVTLVDSGRPRLADLH